MVNGAAKLHHQAAIYRRPPISRVLMVALWLTLAEGRKAGYLLILAK